MKQPSPGRKRLRGGVSGSLPVWLVAAVTLIGFVYVWLRGPVTPTPGTPEEIAARVAPIGQVTLAAPAPAPAPAPAAPAQAEAAPTSAAQAEPAETPAAETPAAETPAAESAAAERDRGVRDGGGPGRACTRAGRARDRIRDRGNG